MTVLRNLRQTDAANGPQMTADFTAPDGRDGCVSCSLKEFEQYGDRLLQEEADACARQAQHHGYRPPAADRYRELR